MLQAYVLVFLQFLFLGGIVFNIMWFEGWEKMIPSGIRLIPLLGALALTLWIFWVLPLGKFSIVPIPKKSQEWVQIGPYRYIRHPMYSALFILSWTWCPASLGSIAIYLGLYLALILTLWRKALWEEVMLQQKFGGDSDYIKKTGRFFPKIF